MQKKDLVRIVQEYYDALEEGNILGRKCTRCGHIEFPPYLACNECGCLDTEWTQLNDMRGKVTQVLPTIGAFGDPEFRKLHGDYWAIGIQIPNIDYFCSSLLKIDPSRYDDFCETVREEDVYVKPLIIQDEDTKVVVWELDDHEEFKMEPVITAKAADSKESDQAAERTQEDESLVDFSTDPIAMVVVECAAMAYEVDQSILTLGTDIRQDLSNESMKMIVMISEIEDELGVTIEIQEAGNLNTLGDFVRKVKEGLE